MIFWGTPFLGNPSYLHWQSHAKSRSREHLPLPWLLCVGFAMSVQQDILPDFDATMQHRHEIYFEILVEYFLKIIRHQAYWINAYLHDSWLSYNFVGNLTEVGRLDAPLNRLQRTPGPAVAVCPRRRCCRACRDKRHPQKKGSWDYALLGGRYTIITNYCIII